MEENKSFEEIMRDLPKEKFLIEFADQVFKDKNLRFTLTPNASNPAEKCLRIYINNSLCLWFFEKENGDLKYDGWEMGDYIPSNNKVK